MLTKSIYFMYPIRKSLSKRNYFQRLSELVLPRAQLSYSKSNSPDIGAKSYGFDRNKGYTRPSTKENAYEVAKSMKFNLPCVILVNPFLDQNIGSVARVMLNFGFTELRLVSPECDHLSPLCEALAVGAFDIVKNAKVYKSLDDCIQDINILFATSDRTRGMTQVVIPADECGKKIFEINAPDNVTEDIPKIGILFGRESKGLLNEEMEKCNYLVKIPTFNSFTSLNLAQAVNILCYEIWKERMRLLDVQPPTEWLGKKNGRAKIATKKDIDYYITRLQNALDDKYDNPETKAHMFQSIGILFQRVSLFSPIISLHSYSSTVIV